MDIRVLGPLEVERDGQVLGLGGRKRRSVLAMLILHAGEAVSIDRLADAVWGGATSASAATTLRGHIHQLRKSLAATGGHVDAAPILRTTPAGYVLDIEDEHIDARRFERLVLHGRRQTGRAAVGAFSEALRLWRGEAFQDFAYADFVQSEARRLEELRLECTEDLFEAQLALGNHRSVVAGLEAFCIAHPTRERALRSRMVALYRCGRQTEALEAYEHGRKQLAAELGADPSPELRRRTSRSSDTTVPSQPRRLRASPRSQTTSP